MLEHPLWRTNQSFSLLYWKVRNIQYYTILLFCPQPFKRISQATKLEFTPVSSHFVCVSFPLYRVQKVAFAANHVCLQFLYLKACLLSSRRKQAAMGDNLHIPLKNLSHPSYTPSKPMRFLQQSSVHLMLRFLKSWWKRWDSLALYVNMIVKNIYFYIVCWKKSRYNNNSTTEKGEGACRTIRHSSSWCHFRRNDRWSAR